MAPVAAAVESYIRIYKRAITNPDYEWVNVYECYHPDTLNDVNAIGTLLEAMVDAERPLHSADVEYVRASMSTWAAEPREPYDPESFVIKEFGAGTKLGTRSTSGDKLPRNVCLSVRRQVQIGRSGRIYLRGVLTEADVTASSSLDWQLTSTAKAALDTALGTMRTAMNTALQVWGSSGAFLAMIHAQPDDTLFYRPVVGFEARGVSTRQHDHKYYDRANP